MDTTRPTLNAKKIVGVLVLLLVLASYALPQTAVALHCPEGQLHVIFGEQAGECITQQEQDEAVQEDIDTVIRPVGEGILAGVMQPFIGLAYILLTFTQFLLFLAGAFFNWMLVETVFEFATNFGNSSGVLIAWGILRDVGNIFLLFSFVFMGIATILNLSNYTMKKTLPRLIIFAVLLNFSLFAAEAVIDVSNGLSAAITSQSTAATECQGSAESCAKNYGVTSQIMVASGLSTALAIPEYDFFQAFNLDHATKQITILLGLTLFSTMLTVVFLAAGIMLIIRIVVLSIIMVTAPLGFAGMAVPFLGDIAKKWWSELINQAMFVPIFLLLVFIGLKIMATSPLGVANRTGGLTEAFASGDVSHVDIVVTFAIVVGFMVAALLAAKKLGAHGADFAIKTAGNTAFAVPAMFGRRVIGGGFARAAQAVRTSTLGSAEQRRFVAGWLDKPTRAGFDFRGTGLPGFGRVDLGKTSGAAAHGIHGIIEEQKKKKIEYNDSVNKAQKEELAGLQDQKHRMVLAGASAAAIQEVDEKIANHPASMVARNVQVDMVAQKNLELEQKNLTAAIEAATAAQEALNRAVATGSEVAQRAAENRLLLAQTERETAQQNFEEARRAAAETREAVESIRDAYHRELEGIREGWANWGFNLNVVADEANHGAIETIRHYREHPEAEKMDKLVSYLDKMSREKAGSHEHKEHVKIIESTTGGGHSPEAPKH